METSGNLWGVDERTSRIRADSIVIHVNVSARAAPRVLPTAAFQQLAEFRYQIRQFLHFSEEAAREKSIEPQQHQLMLAIKGLPEGPRPTVRALSSRLCLRHHSTVELINRAVERGLLTRSHSDEDRREVLVELTRHGEELLQELSVLHCRNCRLRARRFPRRCTRLCITRRRIARGWLDVQTQEKTFPGTGRLHDCRSSRSHFAAGDCHRVHGCICGLVLTQADGAVHEYLLLPAH